MSDMTDVATNRVSVKIGDFAIQCTKALPAKELLDLPERYQAKGFKVAYRLLPDDEIEIYRAVAEDDLKRLDGYRWRTDWPSYNLVELRGEIPMELLPKELAEASKRLELAKTAYQAAKNKLKQAEEAMGRCLLPLSELRVLVKEEKRQERKNRAGGQS